MAELPKDDFWYATGLKLRALARRGLHLTIKAMCQKATRKILTFSEKREGKMNGKAIVTKVSSSIVRFAGLGATIYSPASGKHHHGIGRRASLPILAHCRGFGVRKLLSHQSVVST
jgi:hypothetical protein